MNIWSLLALIVIIAGAYYVLVRNRSLAVSIADEEYCTAYYERIAAPEFVSTYEERVTATTHGCIE